MPRKISAPSSAETLFSTAAAPTLAIVPNAAPAAAAAAPKRARRAKVASAPESAPAVNVAPSRPVFDLSQPNVRKQIAAAYPAPENDLLIPASPEHERAAALYFEARDAAKASEGKKDAAGNVLCDAIRENLGIAGDGWRATWNLKKGSVSLENVLEAIEREYKIARHLLDRLVEECREKGSRSIDVREVAK